MKKIIIPSICGLIAIVAICLIVFLNKPKMNEDKWKTIISKFDDYKSVTIDYNDGNNSYNILKENNNYTFTNLNNNEVLHFEGNMFKYYYEDENWKKAEETNAYPITLDYSLSNYKSLFNSFKYDKKKKCYYIENMNVLDIFYERIEIYIIDDDIKGYKLINNKEISYEFSNYNSTKVVFPRKYYKVYKALDEEEWKGIINNTLNYNTYDYVSLYVKSLNNQVVEEKSEIGEYKENVVYETVNQVNYKYVLNGLNWDYYKMDNNVYEYISSISKEMISFSQKTKIPYDLLINSYDKFEFNDVGNSYTIKNLTFDDCVYEEVIVNIINERIGYVSLKYSYVENDITYDVLKITEFTFNN